MNSSHPRSLRLLSIIDRQIHHLTRLVDDLLDVSRIVHGKISLQQTTLEVTTVINHATEGSLPYIESRHQKLSVRVPEEPNQPVHPELLTATLKTHLQRR